MPDVIGIGFANMDVLAHVPDAFLERYQFQKGHSYYPDIDLAHKVLKEIKEPILIPGGSVANSMLHLGLLDLDVHMISRIGQDSYGRMMRQHLTNFNVTFSGADDMEGRISKQCITLVTPDAQRTFVAPDGAANYLSVADFDPALLDHVKILFIEGFLWRKDNPRDVILQSAQHVRSQGRAKIAFTLPDFDTMGLYHDGLVDFIQKYVDILFTNEEELLFLIKQSPAFSSVKDIYAMCQIVVVTKGEKGSTIFNQGQEYPVQRIPPARLVDTTGAGDAYAAGFLYGMIKGHPLPVCGQLGSLLASEIIAIDGGTPQKNISEVVYSLIHKS